MNTAINFDHLKTAQLLEFYNQHAAKPVKRFSDHKTAIRRCQELAAKLAEGAGAKIFKQKEEPAADQPYETQSMKTRRAVSEQMQKLINEPKKLLPNAAEILKQRGCPYCGDLHNGCTYDDEPGKETEYRYCHICSTSFSANDGHLRGKKAPVARRAPARITGLERPAMKASLKLDRRIRCTTTGEIWKNAHQMWKEHQDWMTSSQQDRLTKELYDAAKRGELTVFTINGREFQLVTLAAVE